MSCNRMKHLDWQRKADELRLEFTSGAAVIQENIADGKIGYRPRIESNNGEVFSSFPHNLDFDNAQAFVRANVHLLDKHGITDAEFNEKLVHTVDLCIERLQGPERRFHRMRLKNIQRWLRQQKREKRERPKDQYDWLGHTFDWQVTDNRYEADTFHDQVIIEERKERISKFKIGSTSRYVVHIIDATGITLKDTYVPRLDFIQAEVTARHLLSSLEETTIDEVYLPLCAARRRRPRTFDKA